MSFFTFDGSHSLGRVRAVDTRRINIQVSSDEQLRRARVSQLLAVSLPGALDEWLIAIIEKVVRTPVAYEEAGVEAVPEIDGAEQSLSVDGSGPELPREGVLNTVHATLVGTVSNLAGRKPIFSRSLGQVPEIDGECWILRDAQLQTFMSLLASAGDTEHSLEIGKYAIDDSASAYLDGNKLFQRHAALLGSTGCGKSWTVAAILERVAALPSSNVILFDLHGEYRALSYARHLRIPGPEDLGKNNETLLYLPFWYLNGEEMQAMFVDRSEHSAHNQVVTFQETVLSSKEAQLKALNKPEPLGALTLDSPVPYDLDAVIAEIKRLNEEMIQGARGEKQGPFYAQFSRLLVRLRSRIGDKRYGFLFQAPQEEHAYEAMAMTMTRLMDHSKGQAHVKVIDFSEVPSEVLPVIVGLVARLIYQIQFWTERSSRRPIALICDEAHLYLPRHDGLDPIEHRAVENFEKIAKEGRKYGVALLIVSQRPADVSPTILSQCNNVLSMRLSNAQDQATVKDLMPESLVGLIDSLPVLDVGEALVVGDAVLLPSRIKITPPTQKPLSATIDFWDEWQKIAVEPDFSKSVENLRRQNRR